MAKGKRSREFLQLQRFWYDKLKTEGFNDLEILQGDGEFFPLLSGLNGPFITRADRIDSIRSFYDLASEFAHVYRFKNKTESKIWALYCEGKPYRAIASLLRTKLCRVYKVIKVVKTGPFEEYRLKVVGEINHG